MRFIFWVSTVLRMEICGVFFTVMLDIVAQNLEAGPLNKERAFNKYLLHDGCLRKRKSVGLLPLLTRETPDGGP
jgi:hypothetical protein